MIGPNTPMRISSGAPPTHSAVRTHSAIVYYNRKTNTAHSRQIFAGFCELARSGAIALELAEEDWNPNYGTENLIKVTINGEMDLLFDTNDGFYWIHEDLDRNIEYFSDQILPKFRYVFKRSCNSEIVSKFGALSTKFQPLGLNYDLTSPHNVIDRVHYGWRDYLKKRVKRSGSLCKVLRRTPDELFHFENFEYPPLLNPEGSLPQILLLTRLWDPVGNDAYSVRSAARERDTRDLDAINRTRIECIEACQEAFAGHFIGGLAATPHAKKIAPHLVAPETMTNKPNFMALVKASPICIATTGVILSTGWRFGEYMAASRAIVSEKVRDVLPGPFRAPSNYLEFSTVSELLRAVRELVADRSALKTMMWNNYSYYRSYGRPDSLIFNALLKALD
jgi:hypothetical protein